MVEINKKDILHHFILNLFTILNAEIIGCKIAKNVKKKILNLIKIASLVISNEGFFLDKKIDFFIQKVNLNEIVDIIIAVNKPKSSTTLKGKETYINADKHYLLEAIKYIVLKLCETADKLNFTFNNKTKTLSIGHNGSELDISSHGDSILSSLNISTLTTNEISYRYALAICSAHKIKVTSTKNTVELKFPVIKI